MTAAGVATRDLVVRYDTARGPVTALHHAGFDVDPGASLAIMGRSGCGKSTLLGLLAGLALPTDGTVTVGTTIVSELPERERVRFRRDQIGMIYQADNLLPHLTAEENIALPLAIGRRSGEDPGELLAELGLADLAERFPDQLSGGQRQRVAVARALVGRPRLLLADEPTGALDEANALGVIELLIDVQRQLHVTLVVVTHDPMVASHCDRRLMLQRPDRELTRAG
jgi:putative ABC transport system ATP-binding protein